MRPDLFHRVMEIFTEVSDLPAGEADARLAELCAGDPSLEKEARRLLEAERDGSGRLQPLSFARGLLEPDQSLGVDSRFRLGEWVVDPDSASISGPSGESRLSRRAVAVLGELASHAGESRTRQQLLEAAWSGESASAADLDEYIEELWRALGDDPNAPLLIELSADGSYRLPGPVSWLAADEETKERYEVQEQVGGGGMGVVYRAYDHRLRRTVALKFLPAEWGRNPRVKERFLIEARAAAALDHPNICPVYEISETAEGRMFLVMPFYAGGSVRGLMREGPMAIEEAVRITAEAARGLSQAHAADIVHRDIKPGNLMLAADGAVKVLDFGIAKLAGGQGLTGKGTLVGTPAYMSPEQARGDEIDRRTDIWSLGVVLLELVTGRRPFTGTNDQAILHAVLDEDLDLVRLAPDPLAPILGRMVARDPDERYSDCEDLLRDLSALTASPDDGGKLATRAKAKRGGWLLWAGAAAAAVLALWAAAQGAGPEAQEEDATRVTASTSRNMTVVLPFENQGPTEAAYFAEGMSDEISARLASIPGLGVISRNSARRYADSGKTLRQIRDELGVAYVLEGRVLWAKPADGPSRVRIIPELVRVADGSQVWSQVYEDDLADVFSLQTEIAQAVVAAIDASLLTHSASMGSSRETDSLEAYDNYLQARSYLAQTRPEPGDMELAAGLLEKAVALDPDFALAHASLSEVHSQVHFFSGSKARLAMAKRSADRALEIAPDLAEAHMALGLYFYRGSRDYARALHEFERAAEISPNMLEPLNWTGVIRKRQGRFEECVEIFEKALELDSRSIFAATEIAICLALLGRHRESMDYWDLRVSLEPPGSVQGRLRRAYYIRNSRGDASELRKLLAELGEHPDYVNHRANLLIRERRFQEVVQLLSGIEVDPAADRSAFVGIKDHLALAFALLGETDLARATARELLPEVERLARENPYFWTSAWALAYLGRPEEALRESRRRLEVNSADHAERLFQTLDLAELYAFLGRPEQASESLEEILSASGWFTVAGIEDNPIWDGIRDRPEFQAVLEKHR